MPKAGIRFGGNAYFKQLLADERGKLTMAKQFVAGLGAGATGRSTYPAVAMPPTHPPRSITQYLSHCMHVCMYLFVCFVSDELRKIDSILLLLVKGIQTLYMYVCMYVCTRPHECTYLITN